MVVFDVQPAKKKKFIHASFMSLIFFMMNILQLTAGHKWLIIADLIEFENPRNDWEIKSNQTKTKLVFEKDNLLQ